MSTRAHTLRNAMFSSIGLYTEFALGMLTSIVIARHLGPHLFGAYSGVIWLMAMGTAISNGTLEALITGRWPMERFCERAGAPEGIKDVIAVGDAA